MVKKLIQKLITDKKTPVDEKAFDKAVELAARSDAEFDYGHKRDPSGAAGAFDAMHSGSRKRYLERSRKALLAVVKNMKKKDWIGQAMKDIHEAEETAEIVDIAPVIAAKAAGAGSDGHDPWLERMPVGTTFLTTKKVNRNEPELVKAFILNKTKVSSQLMVDIPGSNGSITLWYNTYLFEKNFILMDIL